MPEKYWHDQTFHGIPKYRSTLGGSWNQQTIDYYDDGSLYSVNHRGWSNSSGDAGGPFSLSRVRVTVNPSHVSSQRYEGPIWPLSPTSAFTPLAMVSPSDTQMDAWGTTAIARSSPTNPVAGLSQFLGELREGVPRRFGSSITKERADFFRKSVRTKTPVEKLDGGVDYAKGAGGEYLNYQFGWVPFVSDIRKFAYAIKHHNKIVAGYRKGSDKKIQRRYAFPTTTDYKQLNTSFVTPGAVSLYSVRGVISNSYSQECWFEGAFRYHVPVGETAMQKLQAFEAYANHVLGIRLTPELVWELTPWSWLADWYTNIGDIFHNISMLGHDGLVMQYGYMMCHTRTMLSYVAQAPSRPDIYFPFAESSMTKTTESKSRRPATPYGFGLDPLSFSPKQIAILAALGLNKGGSPWGRSA